MIVENDSPHGVLELSSSSVRVREDTESPDKENPKSDQNFLSVIRKLGSFGDVTVSINVIPGSARNHEDYNVVSTEVNHCIAFITFK